MDSREWRVDRGQLNVDGVSWTGPWLVGRRQWTLDWRVDSGYCTDKWTVHTSLESGQWILY